MTTADAAGLVLAALLFTNGFHSQELVVKALLAFAAMSPEAISYTSDRTEFLGRNGSAVSPAALHSS